MSFEILFWFLMIISFIFYLWQDYTPGQPYPFKSGLGTLMIFVLLAILGYAQFGAIVHK